MLFAKTVSMSLFGSQPKSLLIFKIAGQDAMQAFFSLYCHKILFKLQYKQLQIGTIQGKEEMIHLPASGQFS